MQFRQILKEAVVIVKILNTIGETKVISILRKIPKAKLNPTIEALYKGGVRCVEITMDSPDALDMISEVRENYGDMMLVGAGTALEASTARSAILAGADFVLSPTLCTKMIEMCNTYGKLAVPGIFTPTEALTAVQAGAQLVKIFPVSSVGPVYVKDLLGPLSQIRVLPVGGVDAENAASYIKSGAFAVGIGSCLVNSSDVANGNFAEIAFRANLILNNIKKTTKKENEE